ncbi:MAG: hypothetical protein ACRBDI_06530 [Alphaproteobacteria bacterium]
MFDLIIGHNNDKGYMKMSAAENLEPVESKLPENPNTQIVSVLTSERVISQNIQDETIASAEQGAKNLESESTKTGFEAQVHTSAQIINENQAITHVASAENASNDDTYYSNTSAAETHSIQAESHNVLAHSAATYSDESAAKSAALEQVSKVQRAVQEESVRISFGLEEIENRTLAGVEQEMKAMNVVEDSSDTSGATQDLEAQLVATAEASAPKMGV